MRSSVRGVSWPLCGENRTRRAAARLRAVARRESLPDTRQISPGTREIVALPVAKLDGSAPVAQGIERCPAEAEVARSNRAGRTVSAVVGVRS
jgi:hypothetical protein